VHGDGWSGALYLPQSPKRFLKNPPLLISDGFRVYFPGGIGPFHGTLGSVTPSSPEVAGYVPIALPASL
jgi:hypothetical protein